MILFVTYPLKRYLYYFSIIFGYDPNVGSCCFGYIVTQVMVLLDKWKTADPPTGTVRFSSEVQFSVRSLYLN